MRKTLLIIILIEIFSQKLFSQDYKTTPNIFGLGVTIFSLSEYLYESSLGNSIYLTINFKHNFRFEPTFGFSFTDSQSKYICGLGVFKQKDLLKLKLLTGIRFGMSDDIIYYIAPTLGGEYFFDEHFSLGNEIQLRGTSKRGNFRLSSNTSVLLRFYF